MPVDHPLRELEAWIEEARAEGIRQPASVAFVTVGEGGRPSARTVTLKRVEDDALIFSHGSGQGHRFGIGPRLRAAGLILYFDTSALIKLSVVEDGSDLATELWASAYPAASSILSHPEGRAALAAARRQGRLGQDEHAQALAAFEELQTDLITVGVDPGLARRAGEHAEDLGLRGSDAVHLATIPGSSPGCPARFFWLGEP